MSDPPAVDAIIVDGAAVVIQEQPEHSVTMKTVFLPYIDRQSQLHDSQRIYLVGVMNSSQYYVLNKAEKGKGNTQERARPNQLEGVYPC